METACVTSSYVHVQRSLDLVGRSLPIAGGYGSSVDRPALFSEITRWVVEWLITNDVPTLGQQVVRGNLQVGSVFSHTGSFFCRGVTDYLRGRRKSLPDMYAKLNDFAPDLRLSAILNPEHLASTSAADHLSGQRRLFFVGVASVVESDKIEARPVIVGLLVPGEFSHGIPLKTSACASLGELFLSELDPFARAAKGRAATRDELSKLQQTLEVDVKQAFAQIIGEPFVPKDRADEMSDLTTTNLYVQGRQVSAAFAFKGRSKPHPLTVTDMGKNGDQIFRLFNEPSELVVVQHCHQITSAVRAHMRAFATQPGHPKRFALIDGGDTCKILRTFRKLGFGRTRPSSANRLS